MPKPDRQLRQLVHDAILQRKREGGYIVNDFELEITHLPVTSLENAPKAGKVWVLGLAAEDHILTRARSFTREIPIQISLQLLLIDGGPQEQTALIERYEDLEEELRDTVRLLEHEHFAWNRTEPLRDENGTPFNFVGLREKNTFEAIFTAFYKVGLR